MAAYCTARVGEPVETSDGFDVEFSDTELLHPDAVVQFVQEVYDRFSMKLADQNAELSDEERLDLSTIGGFGVALTNRFGGEIEVGWGRKYCVLIRIQPEPMVFYSTQTDRPGTLVFYLDGWHYTELPVANLVTRSECKEALVQWLESDSLPASA